MGEIYLSHLLKIKNIFRRKIMDYFDTVAGQNMLQDYLFQMIRLTRVIEDLSEEVVSLRKEVVLLRKQSNEKSPANSEKSSNDLGAVFF
jgi:hypothetical protein